MRQEKDVQMNPAITQEEDMDNVIRMKHPNRGTGKKNSDNKSIQQSANGNTTSTQPEEMPGILYKALFEQLADYSSDCCISLYIPAVNEQHDRITFKNKLQQVKTELQQQQKMSTSDIDNLIAPGYALLQEEDVWRNMTKGLAVFMSKDYFRYARLNVAPKEIILINHSFYLRPLVPLLADVNNDHFYLLMISKKKAKLFRADGFYMEEVAIDDMPDGIEDVVHFEEKEDQKLFRMGDDGAATDEKENIALYLKEVDRTIWQAVMNREKAPLLLAGIDYLLPIYRSVSSYQHICTEAMIGSYEHQPMSVLYTAAREKMEPVFNKRHEQALDAYCNKLATPLTSSMPETVIPACYYGKVAELFIDQDMHLWGHFDMANNQLELHGTKQDNDDCMIDKAITQTILHGGQVHLLPKDKMPKGSDIAALFRY
jgi:hypothetical protein